MAEPESHRATDRDTSTRRPRDEETRRASEARRASEPRLTDTETRGRTEDASLVRFHLEEGVASQECLEGSFKLEDVNAWLRRDELVHRQRCGPLMTGDVGKMGATGGCCRDRLLTRVIMWGL